MSYVYLIQTYFWQVLWNNETQFMWIATKFIVTFSKCKSDVPTVDLPRKKGMNNIIFILMSKPQLSKQTTLPITDID